MGSNLHWQCYVLVHMFRVTYSRAINISDHAPMVDENGFVFHTINLCEKEYLYDRTKPVMSFACMLPNQDKEGQLRYCILDKDWSFVGIDSTWTILD